MTRANTVYSLFNCWMTRMSSYKETTSSRTARALVDVYEEELIMRDEELLNDEIPRDLLPKELKDDEPSTTKSLIEKPLGIDNEIYDSEGDILFLKNMFNDDPIKDLPPHEHNNDPEGDILC
ncbi:hypothetical protein Tco_0851246 [Tanacetum coccineum]